MLPNKNHIGSFGLRLALISSASLLACALSLVSAEDQAAPWWAFELPEVTFFWERNASTSRHPGPDSEQMSAESSSAFEFPELTFFWQRDSFRGPYKDPEALRIPIYPAPQEERIEFESVQEPSLAPNPLRPEQIRFESTFLEPLEPFLLPEDTDDLVNEDDRQALSLHQALFHAFQSNNSVQVRDLQIAVEDERLNQAESVFIPALELSSEYTQNRFPQNAAEASANNLFATGNDPRIFLSKTGVIEAAIKGENAVGTQYELYTNLRYNESTLTRSSNTALYGQEYTTNLGLRITQPILRNSSRTVREAPIRIARINKEIASADLETELTELAARTLEAYFRWLEAEEVASLRRWEEDIYQELAETVRRRVETGDASTRESLRVEIRLTRVADRILQSEEQIDLARNRLFTEFGTNLEASDYRNVRPTGEMSSQIPRVSEAATLQAAMEKSAQIRNFRKKIEINEENLGIALEETRPTLNLVGGVELRGLDGGPGSSLEYLASNQPVGYSVGIVYSRPWDNASAEAKVRESRLLVRQSEIELARVKLDLRQRIISEIERLESLRSRRDNIKKLQSKIGEEIERENQRLETGQTRLGSLLEFYEELFQVRTQYLSIVSEINESKIKLWAADHSLLTRLGVTYHANIGSSWRVAK